ncbi:NADPH-dependent FMN reductase [Roseibium aggregatum]|uniref:NADPH-dependent FMN reductase n=1 Tax=Roseibium aggregatum TaxID=187304 RepID=UPI001E439088|nr:NAD(P)H-dependent oxidoreductase [Roseibium aggregatum]UES52354.1 NADPH-dependent FMN reductase [Roseibium aggregatum]
MSLKLKIISGSTRPGRVGPTIAKWATSAAEAHGGFEVESIDLADINLPLLDEPAHPAAQQYTHDHTKRWSSIVADADAFLFLTPEYDYFTPASLVNAVQVLYREWNYKPAGIISYGGISGGLRASQTLRELLGNVNVMALPQVVPVPFFPEFINDESVFTPNDKMSEGATQLLGELTKWATALKTMRG